MQHPRSGRQSEVRRPLTVPGSEFWNRLSFTENWNWSTCAVSDFDSLGVYSQVSINRRQEVPYTNSSVGCMLSSTIRGTDNLSSGDATSAEKEGHGVGPMVPTRLHNSRRAVRRIRNSRRSSEVTRHDHHNPFVES